MKDSYTHDQIKATGIKLVTAGLALQTLADGKKQTNKPEWGDRAIDAKVDEIITELVEEFLEYDNSNIRTAIGE